MTKRTITPALTSMGDLLGPEPILLPGDSDAERSCLNESSIVAAAHPSASVAWANNSPKTLAATEPSFHAYAYRVPPRPGPAAPPWLEGLRPGAVFHSPAGFSYGVWRRWRAPPGHIGETDSMDAAWICLTTVTPRPSGVGSERSEPDAQKRAGTLCPRRPAGATRQTGRRVMHHPENHPFSVGARNRTSRNTKTNCLAGARSAASRVSGAAQGPHSRQTGWVARGLTPAR